MANEGQKDGLPGSVTLAASQVGDACEAAVPKRNNLFEQLNEAVDNLESLARSLKANQRRSQFKIVD